MDRLLFDLKYSKAILTKLQNKGFVLNKCLPSIAFLESVFEGLYSKEELKILKIKIENEIGENI